MTLATGTHYRPDCTTGNAWGHPDAQNAPESTAGHLRGILNVLKGQKMPRYSRQGVRVRGVKAA